MGSLLTREWYFFCLYTATAVIRQKPFRAYDGWSMARYTYPRQWSTLRPFPFLKKKTENIQIIYRKMSKIVKIWKYNRNIKNKLKYLKKYVDKYTTL